VNEIVDSDRIALVFTVIHLIGSDEQTSQMPRAAGPKHAEHLDRHKSFRL